MAHSSDCARILSQPCEVFFSGFRANTYGLQQAGWEVSAHQDFEYMRIRLALRHRDRQLYAVTDAVDYNFMDVHGRGGLPQFRVVQMSSKIEVVMHDDFRGFRAVDTSPQYTTTERKSIEDFGIFATPLVRTEEIIVAPADVSELMEQIRRLQSPEQKAIRDREMSRSRGGQIPGTAPVHKFHAQILSFEREAA